jgi:hypothetical protein
MSWRPLGRTRCAVFVDASIVAATGNIYAGLVYPIAVPLMTFIIGMFFLRETKDVRIWDEGRRGGPGHRAVPGPGGNRPELTPAAVRDRPALARMPGRR